MKNPWPKLIKTGNYILDSDLDIVREFNKKFRYNPDYQIKTNLPPEPFIGDKSAPIVLLDISPGFSRSDYYFYKEIKGTKIWQKNLKHIKNEYPFFMLDPHFSNKKSGFDTWTKKLRDLIYFYGAKKISRSIFCINYFPYHSKKIGPLLNKLPSQKYSFYLVNDSINRKAVIILLSGKKHWLREIPDLVNYKNLFISNVPRNTSITPKNFPTGFSVITNILEII